MVGAIFDSIPDLLPSTIRRMLLGSVDTAWFSRIETDGLSYSISQCARGIKFMLERVQDLDAH